MPQQLANFKAEFFKALAHPIRIRMLDCLRDGEKGVNELSEALQIEQANVSQQLAILSAQHRGWQEVWQQCLLLRFRSDHLQASQCSEEHFQQSSGWCTRHAARNTRSVLKRSRDFFISDMQIFAYKN